jgi:hypothetical protein
MMVSLGLAGAHVQPCPRIKIFRSKGDMKNVTPLRLGVFGAVWFVGGLAWFAHWEAFVRAPDWPMIGEPWDAPMLPRMISLLGFLIVIAALVWAIAVRLRSGRARS